MFWKKKKALIKPLLDDGDDNHRDSFRYVFPKESGPELVFKGQSVEVVNISAGGLAFLNNGFQQYDRDRITLSLEVPSQNYRAKFTAGLRILTITQGRICHCIFENCNTEDYEIIHKYVLELQKQDLKTPKL